MASKHLRCAIYTRKSTEHGLELEFNSLDAQRDACAAYIKSQASQGWQCLPQHYDDAAFSGGNLERPALKQLLKDIDAGKVDVVIVYKIDRLTRSLSDFAKLVDVFDAKSVSFVAVTQQFNTTSSMGRLTLNVLLSFAQFERELASERVRDKIAASRAKGKWTGGSVPLGYDIKDKKLIPHPNEVATVKYIFSRYLDLKSIQKLIGDLDTKGIVTKRRKTKVTKYNGGIAFTYGSLANLLKNRVYIGEMGHAGKWFAGEHKAIVDRMLFDQVQAQLKSNAVQRTKQRSETGALLAGKLFDDRGNRMSPSYSIKDGVRYPFYVSSALLRGHKSMAGTVARVSASAIEAVVVEALKSRHETEGKPDETSFEFTRRIARQIEIHPGQLRLTTIDGAEQRIPWRRQKNTPTSTIQDNTGEIDQKLLQYVVRAQGWLHSLTGSTYKSVEELGAAVRIHPKLVRQCIAAAFMAPVVIEAITRGERIAFDLATLRTDTPLSWSAQMRSPSG